MGLVRCPLPALSCSEKLAHSPEPPSLTGPDRVHSQVHSITHLHGPPASSLLTLFPLRFQLLLAARDSEPSDLAVDRQSWNRCRSLQAPCLLSLPLPLTPPTPPPVAQAWQGKAPGAKGPVGEKAGYGRVLGHLLVQLMFWSVLSSLPDQLRVRLLHGASFI